ncbi:Stage V sporulation protein family protein [Anoxybacillus pushchinoensis]|nr:Stage V sporulation protein family protein [Anoxybacillus pushchinoensis]
MCGDEYNGGRVCKVGEGMMMKFYTIKLPKFLGGIVRAMLNSFKKG